MGPFFMDNLQNPFSRVLAKRSDLHLLRKFWHISTGSIGLLLYYRTDRDASFWAFFTMVIALFGFLFDFLRARNEKLNQVVVSIMGPFMRQSEIQGFSGLPFYSLGVSLALFLYKPEIAELSIMFLIFSDPMSSFFGVLFGKDKIMPNKSLQGAFACFFTCYLITLFYGLNSHIPGTTLFTFAVLAGVVGTISELLSAFNIDDNLTIPVISGLGLTIISQVIHIF
jgi:diacylglycerol kinase (CTP)